MKIHKSFKSTFSSLVTKTTIYCCVCERETECELIYGKVIYPHRKDLYKARFWRCPTCGGFVGCHRKSTTPTKPLGCIPTKEIKEIRIAIHASLDHLWRYCGWSKSKLYREISAFVGYEFHTAEIRSVDEGNKVLGYVNSIISSLPQLLP